MSFILNEYEIQNAAQHGVPGAKVLSRFVDMVNANSDGWAYWRGGANAATQLQKLVQGGMRREPTFAEGRDIAKALSPMKALCTRKKLPTDWVEGAL